MLLTRDEVTPEIQAKRELYWEQQRRSLQESQQNSHKLEDLQLHVKVHRPVERCPFGIDRYPEVFYECLRDIEGEEEAQQQKIANTLKHQFFQKLITIEANELRAAEEKVRHEELQRQQSEAQSEQPEDEAVAGDSADNSDIQEDRDEGFLNKRDHRDRELPVTRDSSSRVW